MKAAKGYASARRILHVEERRGQYKKAMTKKKNIDCQRNNDDIWKGVKNKLEIKYLTAVRRQEKEIRKKHFRILVLNGRRREILTNFRLC